MRWRRRHTRPSFNSRPREGATRRPASSMWITLNCFNSRPREGATRPGEMGCPRNPRFNSRPREGATTRIWTRTRRTRVSTHAPARGRPQRDGDVVVGGVGVSTHAPARGRRGLLQSLSDAAERFNSRPREGATVRTHTAAHWWIVSTHAPARGRPRSAPARKWDLTVSTHAPARGRRGGRYQHERGYEFQLTPPRGGDRELGCVAIDDGPMFQLTPPRGGDKEGLDMVTLPKLFQLTPPRGGDHPPPEVRPQFPVSTHAPARGRQPPVERAFIMRTAFQLTPPRGGDLQSIQIISL